MSAGDPYLSHWRTFFHPHAQKRMEDMGKTTTPGFNSNRVKHDNRLRPGLGTRKYMVLSFLTITVFFGILGVLHIPENYLVIEKKTYPESFVIRRPKSFRPINDTQKPTITAAVVSGTPLQFSLPPMKPAPEFISPSDSRFLPEFEPELSAEAEIQEFDIDLPVHVAEYDDKAISRVPENGVSLRKEIIRPDDLDYGRIKGILFQNPERRKKSKGFILIPTVWGTQLRPPDNLRRSVPGLAEAVNRYTDIRAEMDSHLMLDSRKLHSMPFVYITTDKAFELTGTERENFGSYLRNGGFAVLVNGEPELPFSQSEASLRKMLRDSLGAHARFQPIPDCHPLYHCFFDFDDGPPQGAEINRIITQTTYG